MWITAYVVWFGNNRAFVAVVPRNAAGAVSCCTEGLQAQWFVGVVAGMCNCVLHSSVMIRTPGLHNEGLAVWITVCYVSVVAAKVLPVTWMVCHGAHEFKLK